MDETNTNLIQGMARNRNGARIHGPGPSLSVSPTSASLIVGTYPYSLERYISQACLEEPFSGKYAALRSSHTFLYTENGATLNRLFDCWFWHLRRHHNTCHSDAELRFTLEQDLTQYNHGSGRQENQLRFICVFNFAGCASTFESKAAWKHHAVSEHLTSEFWLCTYGNCGKIAAGQSSQCQDSASPNAVTTNHDALFGAFFQTDYTFIQHLYTEHVTHESSDSILSDDDPLPFFGMDTARPVVEFTGNAHRKLHLLPVFLQCPIPSCCVEFHGICAWEERMNHIGHHIEQAASSALAGPETHFGGPGDYELIRWAASSDIGIIFRPDNSSQQNEWALADRKRPVNVFSDSGYYSSRCGTSTSNNPTDLSTDELKLSLNSEESRPQDDKKKHHGLYSGLILNDFTRIIRPSSDEAFKGIDSDLLGMDNLALVLRESLPDLPDLQCRQQSSRACIRDANNITTKHALAWLNGWLNEGLATKNRDEPTPERNKPSEQVENSGLGGSSCRKRVRRDGENGQNGDEEDDIRKQSKDGEDNDNGGYPGEDDGSLHVRRLACPFFKHNPRKYSQPEWKHCAHPGWTSVQRIKEHLYRRHRLPRYQCKRCLDDLKTPADLVRHQRQPSSCDVRSSVDQDGIDEHQERQLRSRKKSTSSMDVKEKWLLVFRIACPNDEQTPSPYQDDQLSIISEYSRFLCREIPTTIRREMDSLLPDVDIRMHFDDIQRLLVKVVQALEPEFRQKFREKSISSSVPSAAGATSMDMSADSRQPSLSLPDFEELIDFDSVDYNYDNVNWEEGWDGTRKLLGDTEDGL